MIFPDVQRIVACRAGSLRQSGQPNRPWASILPRSQPLSGGGMDRVEPEANIEAYNASMSAVALSWLPSRRPQICRQGFVAGEPGVGPWEP